MNQKRFLLIAGLVLVIIFGVIGSSVLGGNKNTDSSNQAEQAQSTPAPQRHDNSGAGEKTTIQGHIEKGLQHLGL